MNIEHLMTLVKVTEWRDGCVYRTCDIGERWIPVLDYAAECELARSMGGDMFASLSTTRMRELNYNTVRHTR